MGLALTTFRRRNVVTGPINFAAFDQGPDDDTDMNELDTYFEAPRIPYHMDPVQWWYARRSE
jgi:hypothetical protein